MDNNKFISLTDNAVADFDSGETDYLMLSRYKILVKDLNYFDFIIETNNRSFFYNQALQIYAHSSAYAFNNIDHINALLQSEYGEIFEGLVSFGQDIFGMQFCFDTVRNVVVFFDSESGERKNIASDFMGWISVVESDLEYYTGLNVLKTWLSFEKFHYQQRLCPKIPFIMGGEYKMDNLYSANFPNSINAYANIARQVYNLPDGTQVKININTK